MAKDEKKMLFDVAKPGSTPPDSSAKPVIVSHKMIKDPMVQEDKAEDAEIENTQSMRNVSSSSGKTIEPVSDTKKEEAKADTATADNDEPSAEPKSEDAENGSETAVVDAVLSQSQEKAKKSKDAEVEAEQASNINKLIDSKKYFVKVKAPKRKRNKRVLVVVVLILMAGLAGVGLAADAELIGLDVPFDFIKKSQSAQQPAVVDDAESKPKDESNSNETADAQIQDDYVVPEGFVVYENKDYGIKFAYPKEWGTIAEVDKGEALFNGTTEQFEDKAAEKSGKVSVVVRKKENYTTVLEKYGPELKLEEGKWVVADPRTDSSPDNQKYAVGDVYAVPIASEKPGQIVYDFSAGDEGCLLTRWIFEVKDGFVELTTPSLCGADMTSASQANIAIDKAVNDKIVKSIRVTN